MLRHEAMPPAQSFEPVSPRMARREPLVRQAESANPSPDDLRAIAAPVPELICREAGEQGAGPYAGDVFHEFAFDDGRGEVELLAPSSRFSATRLPDRTSCTRPDLVEKCPRAGVGRLRRYVPRIGAEKRHPASNRVTFSCRVTEDQGGFLIVNPRMRSVIFR